MEYSHGASVEEANLAASRYHALNQGRERIGKIHEATSLRSMNDQTLIISFSIPSIDCFKIKY